MKSSVIILSFLFSLSLLAREVKVADILTDALDESTVFYLDLNDDNSLQGMHYVTTAGSGQITDDVYRSVDEVLDGGVTVKVMEGREVVRLYLEKFDRVKGGEVRLQYLSNGVTGSKGNSYLKLEKSQSGFNLTDPNRKEVNLIFMKGNWSRVLRRWIGIESVQLKYQ